MQWMCCCSRKHCQLAWLYFQHFLHQHCARASQLMYRQLKEAQHGASCHDEKVQYNPFWNNHVYKAAQLCIQCTISSTHVQHHRRPAFSVASTVCLLACTVCSLCSRCAVFSGLYAVMALTYSPNRLSSLMLLLTMFEMLLR
jgi:hypothetical protein